MEQVDWLQASTASVPMGDASLRRSPISRKIVPIVFNRVESLLDCLNVGLERTLYSVHGWKRRDADEGCIGR